MAATHACRALVQGRVQGVNFRGFVRRKAVSLGLAGYARNLPDGSAVEVYAEGDETGLRALLAHLREEPGLARVDRVEETWETPQGNLREFRVTW